MRYEPQRVDRINLTPMELAEQVRSINDEVLDWMKLPPEALTADQREAIDNELLVVIRRLREAGCDKFTRRRNATDTTPT